ncbi:MAG: hypothetical protein Q8Q00_03575 [Dehalococcoidia bacterium]|nr:hypothetical protein [Dehalococcoidia bacterium]
MATSQFSEESAPDGALAAALIAAGIGVLTLGIVTSAAEAALGFKDWLKWDDTVGPLSGKSSVALIAWAVSWPLLHLALFRRDGLLPLALVVGGILFVLGMIGIFPPVYQAFTVE